MAKPTHLPEFDDNLTNATEPVSGLKTDGYATNDVPTSSNLNWLFSYIWKWLNWVDAGFWECVNITVSGVATIASLAVSTFTAQGEPAFTSTPATTPATFIGGVGQAAYSLPNGAAAATFLGGDGDTGGNGGDGAQFTGGGGGSGATAGAGATVTGGLNSDGVTYGPALKAVHGDVKVLAGGVTATGSGSFDSGVLSTAGNINIAGTSNSFGIPARTTPTLSNGWVNVSGGDSTFGYWKDAFGVVHLDGFVNAAGASSTTIFTLPTGFRPLLNMTYSGIDAAGTTDRLQVNSDGTIKAGNSFGGVGNVCLDGITFRTT